MKELLKKKSVKIVLLLITLLVVMGIVGMNARSAQSKKEYIAHIDAAEKYLTELDYEQAIAEYTLALEIEPNAEEVLDALEQTYLDYAKSYADTGDYEKAIGILEEGYTMTERESLEEQIEEYTTWQEIKEQEEAEAAQREEVKQLVESPEFIEKTEKLHLLFYSNIPQYITDEQIRELCWPVIEALEQYRVLYPENVDKYKYLSDLYYLVGEYELCLQIRTKLYEQFPDEEYFSTEWFTETTRVVRDEYGKVIWLDPNGTMISEFKWQNGKLIRVVHTTEDSIETQVYEYGSDGRISKLAGTYEYDNGEYTNSHAYVCTYDYSEGGFILYTDWTFQSHDIYNTGRTAEEYVVDEYGGSEQVGERVTF